MDTSSVLLTPTFALLLPLVAHAAGGAEGAHSFWQSFLARPPLHPILVNFTAALIPVAFVSDLLGRLFGRKSLTSAGWWMLCYAAAITPATALTGWLWLGDAGDMEHREMLVHKWLGTGLALLLIPFVYWRWRLHKRDEVPGALYLSLAAVLVAALTVQGHLGGMMSFGAAEPSQVIEDAPAASPRPADTPESTGTSERGSDPDHTRAHDHTHAARAATSPIDDGWRDAIDVKE
jgi:uncharacterized membrane protein